MYVLKVGLERLQVITIFKAKNYENEDESDVDLFWNELKFERVNSGEICL